MKELRRILVSLIRDLDWECFALTATLVPLLRLLNTIFLHPFQFLLSTTAGFLVMLIFGWKISKIVVKVFFCSFRRRNLLVLSLIPIITLASTWFLWMAFNSIGFYAPPLVLTTFFLLAVFPPKLRFSKCVFTMSKVIETALRSSKILAFSCILECSLLAVLTFLLISNVLQIRLFNVTVFYGLPSIFIVMLPFVLGIPLFILFSSHRNEAIVISQFLVILTSFWIRTFMIARGSVSWGYDDWFHIGASNFLLNGARASFFNFINWGYGSTFTLVLQSNVAFLSFVLGQSPDKLCGGIAVAMSWSLLVIGAYGYSKLLLKSNRLMPISLYLLLILSPMMILWSLTLTPNSLLFSLIPSFITIVCISPFRLKAIILLLGCSFFLSLVHGFGVLVTGIALLAWLLANANKVLQINYYRLLVVVIVTSLTLGLGFYLETHIISGGFLSRILGAGLSLSLRPFYLGINLRQSSIVKLMKSPLMSIDIYVTLVLACLMLLLTLTQKKLILNCRHLFLNAASLIAILFLMVYIFIDIFVVWKLHLFSTGRLRAPVVLLLMPVILQGINSSLQLSRNYDSRPIQRIRRVSFRFSIFRRRVAFIVSAMFFIVVAITALCLSAFVSIVFASYPSGPAMKKTLTSEEYELLSEVKPRWTEQSILFGPVELELYLQGMTGLLGPTSTSYLKSDYIWNAYRELLSGNLVLFCEKANRLVSTGNFTNIYILNLYILELSEDVNAFLQNMGTIIAENRAGYIVQIISKGTPIFENEPIS